MQYSTSVNTFTEIPQKKWNISQPPHRISHIYHSTVSRSWSDSREGTREVAPSCAARH